MAMPIDAAMPLGSRATAATRLRSPSSAATLFWGAPVSLEKRPRYNTAHVTYVPSERRSPPPGRGPRGHRGAIRSHPVSVVRRRGDLRRILWR